MGKRNPIVHVEWRSKNVEKLQAFYRAAFNWKFDATMPGYALANTGTKDVGAGFMQIEQATSVPQGIVTFVGADDLHDTEEAIREAGGHIVSSAQPVPGWGRFTVFTDPDGNPLALWQSEDAVKKEEKRAAKKQKRADEEQKAAQEPPAKNGEDKARRKEEKKAAKAAQKAQKKAAKASDVEKAATEPEGKQSKKDKKKKGAEAQ